jgi:hypothetical protein
MPALLTYLVRAAPEPDTLVRVAAPTPNPTALQAMADAAAGKTPA